MSKSQKQTPVTIENFQKILLPQIDNLIKYYVSDLKQELTEKINHLPTKAEYYDRQDQTMGELQKLRDEVKMTGQHYDDTNQGIDKIDEYVGFNSNLS
jgi:hypothetical protein